MEDTKVHSLNYINTLNVEIKKQLEQNNRVIYIKMPKLYSNVTLGMNHDKVKLLKYNELSSNKVTLFRQFFHFFLFIAKITFFVAESILGKFVSGLSLTYLLEDAVNIFSDIPGHNSHNINKGFLNNLIYKVNIFKKPFLKEKKIKKAIIFNIDEQPLQEIVSTINDLAFLVKNKNIVDTAIIIVSQYLIDIELKPIYIKLPNEMPGDSDFISDFGLPIYNILKQGEYSAATNLINEYLVAHSVQSPENFNIVMMALSHCLVNLTAPEFQQVLRESAVEISHELSKSIELHFAKYTNKERNYLCFCYNYLGNYYYDKTFFDDNFIPIANQIIEALRIKNAYFALANLSSKINSEECVVNDYIVAYMFDKYVLAKDASECLEHIKNYALTNENAKNFYALINMISNEESSSALAQFNRIYNYVERSNLLPEIKLFYYYSLVNPFLQYNKINLEFLQNYISECDHGTMCPELMMIIKCQFLTYVAIIEDTAILVKIAKTKSRYFDDIAREMNHFENNLSMLKLLRCSNGIHRENYEITINYITQAYNNSEEYYFEHTLCGINLSFTYAMCGMYKDAYSIANNTEKEFLGKKGSAIYLSFYNNFYIIQYLCGKLSARGLLSSLNKLKQQAKSIKLIAIEEMLHINLNIIICSILVQNNMLEIQQMIDEYEMTCQDKYFEFYLDQSKILASLIHNNPLPDYKEDISVFFQSRCNFFKEKYQAAQKYFEANKPSAVDDINKFISKELTNYTSKNVCFCKRVDMFSFIERWYE